MQRRNNKPQTRYWRSVFIIAAFCSAVMVWGSTNRKLEIAQIKQVQAETVATQATKELTDTQKQLEHLKAHATEVTVDDKTRALVEFYINKEFGVRAKDAIKVFTCESHLNPRATHINNPGLGADHGVSQINDRVWKTMFEKTMNAQFDPGVYDIAMNIHMAKIIYDRSNSFRPWVCAHLVGIDN